MQRATGTVPSKGDGDAQNDLRDAVTSYSAQMGTQSKLSQLKSQAEPAIAGAAGKINSAVNDVLSPLSGALGGALGG